ncbi:MAG: iron-sulfur cluster assembly scaffold protein [Candidatus Electryonea clarkiae]|nr:iron-sulfur cluster assembly scaffold protein [Candidatus Electryonea clarkiae]MDP8288177.1 iron-sulfur cluster assembly scaffold protein [Candidatus Electryonea clarkiae]
MAIKYTPKVIQEFTNPENVGEIENANASSTEGSPACGDMITYNMIINPDTKIIEDIKFRSYGCASNIATASVATKIAKGKHIDEVMGLTPKAVTESLDGLPAVKIHCSVLAINGLKSAIRKWNEKYSDMEKSDEFKLDEETIVRALRNVINPETGVSIVKMNMVRMIEIETGKVYVELMMGDTDEMFFNNIEEETREHLEDLPGVLNVIIKLTEGKSYSFE